MPGPPPAANAPEDALQPMSLEHLFLRTLAADRPLYLAPVAALFSVLSWFYRLGHTAKLLAYRQGWLRASRLGCPVISVGNLTLGGTGKTPMVLKIARMLKDGGRRPVILSRGYGGSSPKAVNVVSDGSRILLTAAEAGDEPLLLAKKLADVAVVTGPDRGETGRYAIDHLAADVLILDDGYQHLKLARDVNILLLDWRQPFGNRRLFPAGTLRDPIAESRRADLICFTRCPPGSGDHPARPELPPGVPILHAAHRASALIGFPGGMAEPPEALAGEKVAAFAGIAHPKDFLALLVGQGAEVVHFQAFPDHHRLSERDIRDFAQAAKEKSARRIVVSEKDAVKLPHVDFDPPLFALAIEIDIQEGEAEFYRLLLGESEQPARMRASAKP